MIKQMPELPDIQVYVEQLAERLVGQPLTAVTIAKPFVLRSVDPPIADAVGRRFTGIRRSGKRIVLVLDTDRFLVIHLMIAGRLRWRATVTAGSEAGRGKGRKPPAISPRLILATFTVPTGTLYFTEAGTTRRASLHYVQGESALTAFDRGGLEVLGASRSAFAARLASENHTLKRSLTDPRLFSGIGNAYSDEILHRARLAPTSAGCTTRPRTCSRNGPAGCARRRRAHSRRP
jgi:formamidopyrimidine-DNA glycosylase